MLCSPRKRWFLRTWAWPESLTLGSALQYPLSRFHESVHSLGLARSRHPQGEPPSPTVRQIGVYSKEESRESNDGDEETPHRKTRRLEEVGERLGKDCTQTDADCDSKDAKQVPSAVRPSLAHASIPIPSSLQSPCGGESLGLGNHLLSPLFGSAGDCQEYHQGHSARHANQVERGLQWGRSQHDDPDHCTENGRPQCGENVASELSSGHRHSPGGHAETPISVHGKKAARLPLRKPVSCRGSTPPSTPSGIAPMSSENMAPRSVPAGRGSQPSSSRPRLAAQ